MLDPRHHPLAVTGRRMVQHRFIEVPPIHVSPDAEYRHSYVDHMVNDAVARFRSCLRDAILKDAATAELGITVLIRPDLLPGWEPGDGPEQPNGVPNVC